MMITWNTDYEKISTERLRLLGLNVVKEFETGIRIIDLDSENSREDKPLHLINIPNKEEGYNLQYFNTFEGVGMYEIGERCFQVMKGSFEYINKSVYLDSFGNIIANSLDMPEEIKSKPDLFRIQKSVFERVFDYFENNLDKLMNSQYPYEFSQTTDGSILIVERSSYVIIKIKYNGILCSVLVVDRRTNEVVFKSYGARILSLPIINGNKLDTCTCIMTATGTYIILESTGKVYKKNIISLECRLNKYKEFYVFLNNWDYDYMALDNLVHNMINKSDWMSNLEEITMGKWE